MLIKVTSNTYMNKLNYVKNKGTLYFKNVKRPSNAHCTDGTLAAKLNKYQFNNYEFVPDLSNFKMLVGLN